MNRTNRRAFLVGLESTYKSGSATATEVMQARDINITPLAGNDIERKFIRAYYGNSPMVAGEKHVEVDIEMELAGAGTAGAAPKYAALFKACGMSEKTNATAKTVTYTPVSESESSLVIHAHADGNRHKIRGARGSFSITADADTIPVIKFKFWGVAEPVTSVAVPPPAVQNWVLAQPINTRNTRQLSVYDKSTPWAKFSLDMGIDIVHRKVVGNNDIEIVDRKPSGSLTIEDPNVTVVDYFSKSQNADLGSIVMSHGVGKGNVIGINMPMCGLGSPTYEDSDGVQMLNMSFTPTPKVGNDELVLVYQ